jgi:hypothetical protein
MNNLRGIHVADQLPCPAWCTAAGHGWVEVTNLYLRRHEGHLQLSGATVKVVAEDYSTPVVEDAPVQRSAWAEVGGVAIDLCDAERLADMLRAAQFQTPR